MTCHINLKIKKMIDPAVRNLRVLSALCYLIKTIFFIDLTSDIICAVTSRQKA